MFVVTKTHEAFYSEELFDPEAPRRVKAVSSGLIETRLWDALPEAQGNVRKRGCTAARSQSRPVGGHCERGAGPAEDAVRYFSREMSKKKVVLVAGEQGIGYISQGPMGACEAA
jgi:hypothetical protein